MKKLFVSLLSLLLCVSMILTGTGCADTSVKNNGGVTLLAGELTKDLLSEPVAGKKTDKKFSAAYAALSLNLLRAAQNEKGEEDGNVLLSPLSVLLCLAMTANGASGKTREQMEKVLGNGISLEDLNNYLYTYTTNLYSAENCKLEIADSVWFRQDIPVKTSFLQEATNYYLAGLFSEPFTAETAEKINKWVDKNTDGMIDKVLDDISADSMLYLINAILFDAEWSRKYESYQVAKDTFTNASGKKDTVTFMCSSESCYMELNGAVGFRKSYRYGHYSFAAFLPEEGQSLESFIESISAEDLIEALQYDSENVVVNARLPKYEYDYEIDLCHILSSLGMTDAFSSATADFSEMADIDALGYPLYISKILHKTHIEVDLDGTRAAAVTIAEMKCGSAGPSDEIRYVNIFLNRPFLYAIVDNETGMPVFIGTVSSVTD